MLFLQQYHEWFKKITNVSVYELTEFLSSWPHIVDQTQFGMAFEEATLRTIEGHALQLLERELTNKRELLLCHQCI